MSFVDYDKPDEPRPLFTAVGVWELAAQQPPPWLVHGLVPAEGVTMIFGAPNSGKTFLTLDLAWHVAHGVQWFGRRVSRRDVLYVALEGRGGLGSRMKALLLSKGRENDGGPPPLRVIHGQPFNLLSGADRAALVETGVALKMKRPVIVIDTLACAILGEDENSNGAMSQAVAGANEISQRTGSPVILLHHPSKGNAESPRGGSSLLGGVDTTILVEAKPDGRRWRAAKVRDGSTEATGAFKLVSEKVGEVTYEEDEAGGEKKVVREDVTSCYVVEDRARNAAVAAARAAPTPEPKGANQAQVVSIVQQLAVNGQAQVDLVIEEYRRRLPEPERKRTRPSARVKEALTGLARRRLVTLDGTMVRLPETGAPPSAAGA